MASKKLGKEDEVEVVTDSKFDKKYEIKKKAFPEGFKKKYENVKWFANFGVTAKGKKDFVPGKLEKGYSYKVKVKKNKVPRRLAWFDGTKVNFADPGVYELDLDLGDPPVGGER